MCLFMYLMSEEEYSYMKLVTTTVKGGICKYIMYSPIVAFFMIVL